MTLYVNSRGAHADNIEIEGTGGLPPESAQNMLGVIYFANTGVRFSMFSDELAWRLDRVLIHNFGNILRVDQCSSVYLGKFCESINALISRA